MFRIVEAAPLEGFRVALTFQNGASGIVDLSDLAGSGVFAAWTKPGAFASLSITETGALAWGDVIELCPDALYFELTGIKPSDVFPRLAPVE